MRRKLIYDFPWLFTKRVCNLFQQRPEIHQENGFTITFKECNEWCRMAEYGTCPSAAGRIEQDDPRLRTMRP